MKAWLVLAWICATSPARADATGDFVRAHMAKKRVPGLAIMVRDNGKLVRAEGYGMANLEHAVPVTAETVFQSGSMGKQFTAMAVLILVEQGKLTLDDTVAKHLAVPASWAGIKIRHLLTHTSGLGDYPERFSLQRDYTEDELLSMIVAQPLAAPPGDRWSYSNLGYVTLGILIHKASGQGYGDLLKQRVFGPLGMKATRIIDEAEIIPHRAAGYRIEGGALKNQEWVSPTLNTTADGSLYVTVVNLARWDEALEAQKIVGRESYAQMWKPVRLNDGSSADYGFGWSLHTTPAGHRIIEHGGAWQGFMSYIVRYPDDRLSVAVLCNLAGADPAFIAHRVAGFYRPALASPSHRAVRVDPAMLKTYEGDYRLDDRLTITLTSTSNGRLVTKLFGEKRELIPGDDFLRGGFGADLSLHQRRKGQGDGAAAVGAGEADASPGPVNRAHPSFDERARSCAPRRHCG